MKKIALIFIAVITLTSCTKPLSIDNLYDKCKDKSELSILNYLVQFQVLEDISGEQLAGLFDKEMSKAESVDLCECFVTNFKNQSVDVQQQTLAKVQAIDEELRAELKVFSKNGLLGKFSNREAYERVESFIPQLPKVRQLIEEMSRNKFQHHVCLVN